MMALRLPTFATPLVLADVLSLAALTSWIAVAVSVVDQVSKPACVSALWINTIGTLDFDPETEDVYDFITKRRRPMSRMSDLQALDLSLDIDPETGKPYGDSIVEVLDPRAITYGAPVTYTVTGPSGNSWQITMNCYPNGQNGSSLTQANANAGRVGASECYDCENVGISFSSDDPDNRPITEHIYER
ncbi:hypothetical protein BDV59DRAFT_156193 [Aspergillus ambiguus]|uniref:uncharacterized protein n=1 Tax=Aspergillus ambiguus TaxID=176160 RepID=UPI003CCE1F6D